MAGEESDEMAGNGENYLNDQGGKKCVVDNWPGQFTVGHMAENDESAGFRQPDTIRRESP
jgi:hypothetical protein